MKIQPLIVLIVTLFVVPADGFGQGALTPPGAPAPTMKSLDQIETRTPISSLPFTIPFNNNSGSYYLTKNLSVSTGNGIDIQGNNVTVDLNGFTISSTADPANGSAILIRPSLHNITIKNGFIEGTGFLSGTNYLGAGFDSGINYINVAPVNAIASHVSVRGVKSHGINLGAASTVAEACSAQTGTGYGIVAGTVRDCIANEWGVTAIFGATVSNCRGISVGGFDGISASTAENCYAQSNSGDGIGTDVANNCVGSSTSGIGINARRSATNCYALTSSGNWALQTDNALNCNAVATLPTIGALSATTAVGCYGFISNSGSNGTRGIEASFAQMCYGSTVGNGIGLNASIAVGCVGFSASGTALSANHRYLSGLGPDS